MKWFIVFLWASNAQPFAYVEDHQAYATPAACQKAVDDIYRDTTAPKPLEFRMICAANHVAADFLLGAVK